MLKMKLVRKEYTDKSTIGSLYFDDVFECYILEDCVRMFKIPGKTAIPAGIYKVIISFSNRFQCDMPLIVDVPNFTGIRIHWGNSDKDTEGCPLTGQTKKKDFVGNSRLAYLHMFAKMRERENEGMQIEIIDNEDSKRWNPKGDDKKKHSD